MQEDQRSSKVFASVARYEIDGDPNVASSAHAENVERILATPSVICKREVDACRLLRCPLLRRKDKKFVERCYQDAVEEFHSFGSEVASAADGESPAGRGGGGQQQSPESQLSKKGSSMISSLNSNSNLAQQQKRRSDLASRNMASFANVDLALLGSDARQEYFRNLQRARRILLEAADDSVQKEIFGDVPQEWLNALGAIIRTFVFACLLAIIPVVGLMLDCSDIVCAANSYVANFTDNSSSSSMDNITAAPNGTLAPTTRSPLARIRKFFLHVENMHDCPFSTWSNAMFGVWVLVGAAFLFGVAVASWSVLDKCCGPMADRVRDSRKAVANAMTSVPFRTRCVVVVPPLLGLAATGSMIYSRLNADASRVTWSWGFIVAPAIVGLGLALLLKGYLTWKFLSSGNAAAMAAMTGNAIPAYWAIRLFVLDAVALFAAAVVSPSIAAKMADCEGYINWDGVFIPVFFFLGLNSATSLIEWLYRLSNSGDADSQQLSFDMGSQQKPLWQDALRLIFKQGGLLASSALAYLKLEPLYSKKYDGVRWFYAMMGLLVAVAVSWLVALLESFAAVREAKNQYQRLDALLTTVQVEESLGDFAGANNPTSLSYGAAEESAESAEHFS